jgi:hypothetical protein
LPGSTRRLGANELRIIESVTEDEVIGCFLRAELDSGRYREVLLKLLDRDGVDVAVLARPDLTDAAANRYRSGLLDEYRGFEQRIGLFGGFPDHVDWHRATLSPPEVLDILYIDWDWWLEISDGTRRPKDAAEKIRRGDVPGTTVEEHRVLFDVRQPELIVVTKPDHAQLVVLEGHYRLTAYAMFPELLPEELEVYLGEAEDMGAWGNF